MTENPNSVESFFDYFKESFWREHGAKVIVGLALAAIAVFAGVQHLNTSSVKSGEMAEELGKGLEYLYTGKQPSALFQFETSIQGGTLEGLPLAKAALLAANIHLQTGNLDSAENLYRVAVQNGKSVELIVSAARHGLAAVAMEKQNYTEAILLLNDFVDDYGKRTGDLSKRYAKLEPADLSPVVADALWKLALCYVQIEDLAKAKQTAKKIVKIYGDSPKALLAQKLLATL